MHPLYPKYPIINGLMIVIIRIVITITIIIIIIHVLIRLANFQVKFLHDTLNLHVWLHGNPLTGQGMREANPVMAMMAMEHDIIGVPQQKGTVVSQDVTKMMIAPSFPGF